MSMKEWHNNPVVRIETGRLILQTTLALFQRKKMNKEK